MRDSDGDWGGPPAPRPVLMAEMLGLAMARRAADILDRHRDMLTRPAAVDPAALAADDAIFTAVLDAASDCLGRFGGRPTDDRSADDRSADDRSADDRSADDRSADDRWCDALLQLLQLAQFAAGPADAGAIKRAPAPI